MKKLLLATSCLALSSAAVMAADLPMVPTKAPVVAAPVFTWTGCYVGAHVGGGMMTNTEGSQNGKGALAGGQAGCNYQDGNWVFGVEGEGSWSGIKTISNDSTAPGNVFAFTPETFTSSVQNKNDFSIAARAGIAFDRTLIYGKGGWAWGSFSRSSIDAFGTPTSVETFTQSGTLDGFLVGAGIEHALTRNWTVKFEYNFIGFGGKELAFSQCLNATCAPGGTSTLSATKQVFKIGANYLFDIGGAAPLVARY